jgi:cytidylate kinase
MPSKVVCISAADGSGGEDVGARVANKLGFRLVNEEIVGQAADRAGIPADVMADVEQRRSVVSRVIREMLSASSDSAAVHGFMAPPVADPAPTDASMRGVIRGVIEDVADRGEAVIVSHAASHALANRADALRVLITAGPDTRRERIAEAGNLSAKDADKRVARGDTNRADYIKRFYGIPHELPTHYDLVINSDRLSVEQAVDLIVRAASQGPSGDIPA